MTDTSTDYSASETDAVGRAGAPSVLSPWESFSFAVIHAAASVLLFVLTLRGLYAFGYVFGSIEYLVNRSRRRRFARKLSAILERTPTGRERRKWTHAFFVRTRCDKLFYLIMDRLSSEKIASLIHMENESLLRSTLDRGRGILVCLQHLGSHHIGGTLLAFQGFKIAGVRDLNESASRRFMQQRWERNYPQLRTIKWGYANTFPREIYRWYQQGYLVGAAIDPVRVRDPKQKAAWLEVFGERRPFLTGPLHIALRCEAPVLHGWVEPLSGFRYRIVIAGLLIDPETMDDTERSIDTAIDEYAATLVQTLKRCPSLVSRL